jgi:hypothetical protein
MVVWECVILVFKTSIHNISSICFTSYRERWFCVTGPVYSYSSNRLQALEIGNTYCAGLYGPKLMRSPLVALVNDHGDVMCHVWTGGFTPRIQQEFIIFHLVFPLITWYLPDISSGLMICHPIPLILNNPILWFQCRNSLPKHGFVWGCFSGLRGKRFPDRREKKPQELEEEERRPRPWGAVAKLKRKATASVNCFYWNPINIQLSGILWTLVVRIHYR